MDDQAVPRSLRIAAAIGWRFLVVVLAIVVIALALATLRLVILPAVIALLLATLLAPPVQWLRAHRVPRALASLLVLLGAALVVFGVLALVVGLVVNDLNQFADVRERVDAGVDRAVEWIADSPLGLTEADLVQRVDEAREQIEANAGSIAGGAFSGALILVEVLAGGLLTLVLLFFFVQDGAAMWNWVVRLFPDHLEEDVRQMGRGAWATLGGYLRGTAAVAFVDAVLIGLALVLIGVPFALPLAVLIFFGGFVPIVGAFVTGFAAVMVAVASDGFISAALVLGSILAVQQIEGNLLQPLLVGRSVRLHPAVVILAVTIGGIIWGIPGAFVAVPLTAVLSAVGTYLAAREKRPPREAAAVMQGTAEAD